MHPITHPHLARPPRPGYPPPGHSYLTEYPYNPLVHGRVPRAHEQDLAYRTDTRWSPASSTKSVPFDTAVSQLSKTLKHTVERLHTLKEEFDNEVQPVTRYSRPEDLNVLWERKFNLSKAKYKDVHRLMTQLRKASNPDDESLTEELDINSEEVIGAVRPSAQLRESWKRLTAALKDAACIKAVLTPERKATKSGKEAMQDKAGIERTVNKLRTMGPECVRLMESATKDYVQISVLQEELKFLQTVVERWASLVKNNEDDVDDPLIDDDLDDDV